MFVKDPPTPSTRSETDRELQSIRTANDWFGAHLFNWLSADWDAMEELAPDSPEAAEASATWRSMLSDYAFSVGTNITEIGHRAQNAAEAEGKAFPGTEINFHILNHAMLAMWSLAIGVPTDHSRAQEIRDAQISLALAGTHHAEDRDRRTDHTPDAYYAEENAAYRRKISGIATELDAAIVLLELCKRHPDLCVLPAPRRFEAFSAAVLDEEGRHVNANSDFVVFNTKELLVIGVQVKTSVGANTQAYSNDHVVLLDGVHDLGNTRAVRLDPRRSDRRIKPWPGLIALGFLADVPAKVLRQHAGATLRGIHSVMRDREQARTLVGEFPDMLEAAVQRAEALILPRVTGQTPES
ncbi:hypothetical protein ACLM5J_04320 [Nocardioides sp. Bht2]|uniref:hypothetical protein n=1 Tax=Nocardioides sp. Bht2 TaxID=3392297 RepID=UPI0039B3B257